jgi:hypothetical protein
MNYSICVGQPASYYWALGTLGSAVFPIIFLALFAKSIENPVLVSLILGGVVSTLSLIAMLIAGISHGGPLFDSAPVYSHFGTWAWVVIGACFLGFIYFRIFRMVLDFLGDVKNKDQESWGTRNPDPGGASSIISPVKQMKAVRRNILKVG